ncbi:MAG: adenosylcobinamide-GDP ribazoletransferase [Candidatus Bathyarchaeia archaeon]
MTRKIRNLIAFLTIFPVGMTEDCLVDAADLMYLFPAVGALIGFIAGLFTFAFMHVLPSLVVGAISCGFILLLTGLHHMDGLLDFGDGLMCHGLPERKIEAMHDKQTGTGGFMLGSITVLITALCISQLDTRIVLQGLTMAEAFAKLSMVILAWSGRSAHEGMNTYFINAMHRSPRKLRLAISLAISLTIALICLKTAGLIVLGASLVTALVILKVSNRHFNGITGDVMGASNELTRMASLLVILVLKSTGYI